MGHGTGSQADDHTGWRPEGKHSDPESGRSPCSVNSTSRRDPRAKQRPFLKRWSCHFCLGISTFSAVVTDTKRVDGPSDTAQFLTVLFISTPNRNV